MARQVQSLSPASGTWDDELTPPPTVQVLDTRTAAPAAPAPASVWSRGTLPGAQAALSLLGSLGGVDAWAVTRITEDTWTGLAVQTTARTQEPDAAWSRSRAARYEAGTPVSRDRSLCHHLLTGPQPAVVTDLSRSAAPDLRRISEGWGLHGYLGIALMGRDGRQLGSLAGLSATPLRADERNWTELLAVQAGALQASLSADIAALHDQRQDAFERSLESHDDVTRLPNRRGWASLLATEERLATPVGDPVGMVLVDLGVIRTVRSLRRAVSVVREAAGEVQLARVGPRQLGLLGGGLQTSQTSRVANLVQARLEGAGYRTATAHTMRAGVEPLATTWARAENALVQARREQALDRRR
ncbi:GGDEF domain-containing protein [Klenkia sp. PcliD-1-E]|uniref:GGDEF domain-containing protein n=1 Tax=Klenkia sp. PcliD-1-E TaxID=2954492 RepID=UPI00209843EB|nr:GGDEF domain-containing protein [Klenkia sp. PcliD-1-E]MCO7221916.1 GGDEF domain-containing protein [Klenkia sp. PcliD-1-E]